MQRLMAGFPLRKAKYGIERQCGFSMEIPLSDTRSKKSECSFCFGAGNHLRRKAKLIQWDYKNIVKRKGKLVRLR